MDGKHGVSRAAEFLGVYQEIGYGIIGLQETRRSDQSALLQAGYVVYCSGESRGDGEGEKGQGGVGLAVRKSISYAEAQSPEFSSDMPLKVTLELCGRAWAVTFVVGYAPTDTYSIGKKKRFLGSPGKGREGSAGARTSVCVNGRQCAHGTEGRVFGKQ